VLDVVETEPSAQHGEPEPVLAARLELRLIDHDGRSRVQPLHDRQVDGFRAAAMWRPLLPATGIERGWEVELSLISHQANPGLGVQVVLPLQGPVIRFMVPGIVYGENRLEACRDRYPRVSADGPGGDALTSDRWAFRADRASHPVVLGWTGSSCVALAVDESSPIGLNGLAFGGGPDPYLLINFPAREEPVTYLGHDAPGPPEVRTHEWQAGEVLTLTFRVFEASPGPHAYDAVLRAVYARDRTRHRLNPWMSPEEAAALTAYGLHRWHYSSGPPIPAEAVAFRPANDECPPPPGDQIHVAWVRGAPSAYALLTYARRRDLAEYADAAISVLDTCAEADWKSQPDRIHSGTIAESTLFMIRALRFEASEGIDHPTWKSAIVQNLNRAMRSQRDGAFPRAFDGGSVPPERGPGAAGLLWIPTLLEGAGYLEAAAPTETGPNQSAGAQTAAEIAGAAYARFVEGEFIYGAGGDHDLAPSSEDGANAVMAYVALYEATRKTRWLTLACHAADWMLSFRWSYNLRFPEHTLLETYDFRTRGADVASPRNQQLHGHGLLCLPEMMRLAEHTGDRYYLERTRDNLACFLQFIAREDGDFNARKGMVTERYFNSRGAGPKGAILPIAHARSAGLVLYACQAGLSLDE
jgi:hypothetical protein